MPDALGISRLVHESFFHRFRVSIDHCQAGAHGAFRPPAPLFPFLERARTDGVAQTAAFAVCGSSLGSCSRNRGQTPFGGICGFPYGRTADPKDGDPRYTNPFAGGACVTLYLCAPRTRATSLSPRPASGRFWLQWHRQECLCHSRFIHEGFFHRFRVSIHHRQIGAHRAFRPPAPLLPFLERARLAATCS
jgi:hypothetical protein